MIRHWFLFLVSWLLLTNLAVAQEIPVNIKADRLKIIEETGLVEASGSVEVVLKNVTIKADRLLMDPNTNIATAEGHVKIADQDYRATASSLVYDASSEATSFTGFQTKMSPRKLNGRLYLSARELDDLGNRMMGQGGALSTCDNSEQHYFMTADKVEYYQDDKLIGYNAVVHVGNLPVFWLPVVYYDLSQQGRKNWIFGHNEVEGDFVKSAWGYPLGMLYLDLTEKKGWGQGTSLAYGLGALGAGSLFLYHLDEKDTSLTNWVTRIDHTKQLSPTTSLNLKHEFAANYLIPSGRKDQTSFNLNLNYADQARGSLNLTDFDDRQANYHKYALGFNRSFERSGTNYGLNYDYSKKEPFWIRSSQQFSHRQPLVGNIMFSGRADYYNNIADAGQPGDERLDPAIELTGSERDYSWRLTENWYLDLDRDDYRADENIQYLEKQPELEITPRALDLYLFNLRPKFGYGYYHEVAYASVLGRNRSFSTERYQTTLDLDKSVPLGAGTNWSFGLGLDQFAYTPGDQLYAYREQMSLRSDLGGFFRHDLSYRKGSADGNSPFMFDRLGTAYHNATDRLEFYHQNLFSWSFDGGHNWQTHQWFDVNSNLWLRPAGWIYWNLRSGWEIENTRYKDLVNNLTYSPYSFFNTTFSTVSSPNNGKLSSGSVLYDLYFLEDQPNEWHLKLSQVYEPASDQFKLRDIMVVKQLHCWLMTYTYSDYRKEFSMTFSLQALPDQPLGMSSGRGVYFDALENQVKGLKYEGEIKRY